MKLRAITLTNVRRFTDPVRLGDIGDGLNLLCERNEQGKSTLFDAVQALFYKPHGSRDRDVTGLRPHAGGAPEVEIEVETSEGRFAIAKRWLSKPAATVTQGGRLVAQADAAEAWISALLGGADAGPAGLIWVRQGLTGLSGGTKKEEEAAQAARRDLLSSVTGEVEAMTGGRRMDMALSRCRAELGDYATATGRPRTGGPWKAAQDRVETLQAERESLAATAQALHQALDRRKRLRRDLAELDHPDAAAARRARTQGAVAAKTAADAHAERLSAARRRVDTARLALAAARDRADAVRAARDEARAAGAAHTAAREAAESTRAA
ncbi:chromosome segregation protein SMC, partial [Mesobaculum littorinae]